MVKLMRLKESSNKVFSCIGNIHLRIKLVSKEEEGFVKKEKIHSTRPACKEDRQERRKVKSFDNGVEQVKL